MMKINALAACGNGMGSSQMIKMKIAKVYKKLNIDATIDHMSVGEAKTAVSKYDMVFVSQAFTGQFKSTEKTKIVGLVNVLSEKEIEEKIRIALDLNEE